jgi:hypothetical protein
MKQYAVLILTALLSLSAAGCFNLGSSNNKGQLQSYPSPLVEAGWIRNGDPIVYEGRHWFPVDDLENLLDSEVFQIGEFQDVQIFVEKVDSKPYDRLYTKFAKGKYRYYERLKND